MRLLRLPVVMAMIATVLVACSENDGETDKNRSKESSTPEVTVMTVTQGPVENTTELPGRVQSVRVAEIRARVDGVVERRLYQEGTDVEAGAPLFRIDPREKRASLDSAEAVLVRAEATEANAR